MHTTQKAGVLGRFYIECVEKKYQTIKIFPKVI